MKELFNEENDILQIKYIELVKNLKNKELIESINKYGFNTLEQMTYF